MSRGHDGFLARWSRRKRAQRARDTEAMPRDRVEEIDGGAPAPQPDSPQPEPIEAEPVEPAEPLPRIEDLTSESDLTAFLRKGVPGALRSAAMRKMWSLEPGIRNYVGPAEYAWDFNQPGSMAGFGPLDAKDTLVEFLSRTGRAIGSDTDDTAGTAGTHLSVSPEQQTSIAPDSDAEPDPAENPANEPAASRPSDASPETTAFLPGESGPATSSQSPGVARPSQSAEPLARPRHGSAMPR